MFAPVNPSLTFRKVGFKGVYFSWTCYPDGSLFLCYYELCPLSAAMVMLGQSAVLSTLVLEEPAGDGFNTRAQLFKALLA